MKNLEKEICEGCGKLVPDTEGTSYTGCYCIECLRLVRAECLEAIKTLQQRAHERRINS